MICIGISNTLTRLQNFDLPISAENGSLKNVVVVFFQPVELYHQCDESICYITSFVTEGWRKALKVRKSIVFPVNNMIRDRKNIAYRYKTARKNIGKCKIR